MPSAYIHRLWAVIPASNQSAANTWITANLNPDGGPWFAGSGLSVSGNTPATYFWINTALTDADLTTLLTYLCGLVSVSLPSNWDTYQQTDKQSWVSLNMTVTSGLTLLLDDNLGAWTDPSIVLSALGLQAITTGP